MQGHVTRWFDDRGYGFLKGQDGLHYFCHITKVAGGVNKLQIGAEVSFDVDETPRGLSAINVLVVEK